MTDAEALSPAEAAHLANPRKRRVALLGTGHIGGSLALALRAAGLCDRVVGFDRDPEHAAEALARGLCDEIAPTAAAAAAGADLAILAVPVGALGELARAIAPGVPGTCLVLDVGSTKARPVAAIEAALARPGRFVGSHPLAGAERTGPGAASAELFRGRRCLLTPTDRTLPEALTGAEAVWRAVGARTVRMDAERHDAVLAAVSHLPHAAAYALVDAVAQGGPEVRGLAGGGFLDTTRIASSDPVMWRDIFLDNRERVVAMIDRLEKSLGELRRLVAAGDGSALEAALARIRAARQEILE